MNLPSTLDEDAPARRPALWFSFLPRQASAGSWWVDADRATLNAQAEAHRERMRNCAAFYWVADRSLAKMCAPIPGTARDGINADKLALGCALVSGSDE